MNIKQNVDLADYNFITFSQLNRANLEYSIKKHSANVLRYLAATKLPANYNQLQYNLYLPLYKLYLSWNTLLHLLSVTNSTPLRELHDIYQNKISTIEINIHQNKQLYACFKSIKLNDYANLNQEQQKVVMNTLQEFELNGINLPLKKQLALGQFNNELDKLARIYEQNCMDARLSHTFKLTAKELSGMPEYLLSSYPKENGYYLVNLQDNSYHNCMSYINKRSLRKNIHRAYRTLASESTPQWDNRPIIKRILKLRKSKAKILGLKSYAELASRLKMASSTQVEDLLTNLINKALPQAKLDLVPITKFALNNYQLSHLEAWDLAYISEKYQISTYGYSSEDIKKYFTLPIVLKGLFDLLKKLFNIEFEVNHNYDTWHKDVICYDIYDRGTKAIATIYLDLIERADKQSGAWMNGAIDKYTIKYKKQIISYKPQAYIVCNFNTAPENNTNLLSLDDVQTLFHEMGHALHHCLSTIEEYSISGINNVEFDATELPSQLLENFVWNYDIITSITKHITTNEVMPKYLYNKMWQNRLYLNNINILRQCELALFDLKVHQVNGHNSSNIVGYISLAKKIANMTKVLPLTPKDRYPNTFSHIFASDYAASYYSYRWAEILALDIYYAKFANCSISDYPRLGKELRNNIFCLGGLNSMQNNFINLMNRPPQIDALLKHNQLH